MYATLRVCALMPKENNTLFVAVMVACLTLARENTAFQVARVATLSAADWDQVFVLQDQEAMQQFLGVAAAVGALNADGFREMLSKKNLAGLVRLLFTTRLVFLSCARGQCGSSGVGSSDAHRGDGFVLQVPLEVTSEDLF